MKRIKKLIIALVLVIALIITPLSIVAAGSGYWIFDEGASFDTNDYMHFPTWSPVGADFTIEFWFRQYPLTLNRYLLTADTISSNGSIFIRTNNDDDDIVIRLVDDTGNIVNINTNSADIQDEEWHKCAVAVDRGNDLAHVYIDGVVGRENVDISTLTDDITISDGTMRLNTNNAGTNYNKFDIAELSLWSDVRTPTEIIDNLYIWLAGTEANLERYYTFDDGTGTTVTDMVSGGSNDGTLVNPTWIEPIPVVMGNSSVSVPSGIEDAIELSLNDSYRPDSALEINPNYLPNMWAVTSYTETDTADYYWISLTGIVVDDPTELDDWDMSLSMWAGIAIAEDTVSPDYESYVDGDSNYTTMIGAAGLSDIANPDVGGPGSATYYFPWAAGYEAYYGVKGVHKDVGPPGTNYGGEGWLAVDWVGGATGYSADIYPNAAYVSESGKISFRCEDDVQVWVEIGDFLYGHLVDNATLEEGVYHSQGSYLGALVTGSHIWKQSQCITADADAISSGVKCGITCQRDTSYHIHWGFLPDPGYFQTENWVLNTSTEYWNKGETYIGPGEYMLAEWANRPIVPTPGPTVTPGGPTVTPSPNIIYDEGGGSGSNFWDGVIAGVVRVAKGRADDINDLSETGDNMYQDRGIVTTAASGIRIAIRTMYVLLVSNLNMTIAMIVLTLIFILEPIRLVRAAWLAIKEMIPFIG